MNYRKNKIKKINIKKPLKTNQVIDLQQIKMQTKTNTEEKNNLNHNKISEKIKLNKINKSKKIINNTKKDNKISIKNTTIKT